MPSSAFSALLFVALSAGDDGVDAGAATRGPPVVTLAVASEDPPSRAESSPVVVRPAFRGAGSAWQGQPSVTGSAKWTVCFDGRSRGVVESEPRAAEELSRGGTHALKRGRVPFVGARSLEFAGWPGEPVHRPLVLSSTGQCGDPDAWKPRPAPLAVLQQVHQALRAAVRVQLCAAPDRPQPWSWPEHAVQTVKAWASSKGDWLVLVRLVAPTGAAEPRPCDEVLGDEWAPQLFAVRGRDEARHLGSGMSVIDAGDYDGDGRSELVVMQASYNHDGYVLFFDGFARRASVEWSYH